MADGTASKKRRWWQIPVRMLLIVPVACVPVLLFLRTVVRVSTDSALTSKLPASDPTAGAGERVLVAFQKNRGLDRPGLRPGHSPARSHDSGQDYPHLAGLMR
jgi:hypothetical protein